MTKQACQVPGPIRVVLAEDHQRVRGALKMLLRQAGMEVVGEVEDGRMLGPVVAATAPDLLLMDAVMPHHDPVEAVVRLHTCHPGLKIVILSAYSCGRYVADTLAAGADGYIAKDELTAVLGDGLRQVMAGRCFISQKVGMARADIHHDPPLAPGA